MVREWPSVVSYLLKQHFCQHLPWCYVAVLTKPYAVILTTHIFLCSFGSCLLSMPGQERGPNLFLTMSVIDHNQCLHKEEERKIFQVLLMKHLNSIRIAHYTA